MAKENFISTRASEAIAALAMCACLAPGFVTFAENAPLTDGPTTGPDASAHANDDAAPTSAARAAGVRFLALKTLELQGGISHDELNDAALVLDSPDSKLGEFDRSRRDAYISLADGKLTLEQFRNALQQAQGVRLRQAREEFDQRAAALPASVRQFGDTLLGQTAWSDSEQKQRDLLIDFAEGRIPAAILPAQLLLVEARNLDKEGNQRGALEKLNDLRNIQPDSREADILRQEIAKELIFARNEAERKRRAASAVQSGTADERAGRPATALNDYSFALAMSPTSTEAKEGVTRTQRAIELQRLMQEANERQNAGDLAGAMEDLNQLRNSNGDSAEVLQAYQSLKDRIERKNSAVALMAAASALENQGDIQGAIAKYDQAIQNDPGLTEATARRSAAIAKGAQRRETLLAEAHRAELAADYPAALRSLDALGAGVADAPVSAFRQKVQAEMQADADRKESQLLAALAQARQLAEDGNPKKAQALLDKVADPRADLLRTNLAGQIASADAERRGGDAHITRGEYGLAARSYQNAVKGGDVRAMTELGRLYRSGLGVKPDAKEAARWFRQAADLGDGEAMEALANLLLASDATSAADWFKRAAAAGRPGAYRPLAEMYEHGRGVTADPGQAAVYYRSAAANRDVAAMYRLAQMYEAGIGVAKDLANARAWYKQAADNGNAQAVAWIQKSDAHARWLLNNGQ